ncbi:MAG TPA: DUF1127 domain-containing protein [Gammaproteobacteria bacterium]|nr:DUF1127 domain-containing protein [Gammaproteobacteria bacterium]
MRPQKHGRIDLMAAAGVLVKRLRHVGQERATERQLMGLPDHTLRDIGISRTDIPFIAIGIPPRTD